MFRLRRGEAAGSGGAVCGSVGTGHTGRRRRCRGEGWGQPGRGALTHRLEASAAGGAGCPRGRKPDALGALD